MKFEENFERSTYPLKNLSSDAK